MFVLSLRRSKIIAIIVTVLVLAICISTFVYFIRKSNEQTLIDSGVNTKASTASERVSFLSQFGWDIDIEPLSVKEIVIPLEFDEEYEKYNDIQKKQNFDLSKYSGERAKMWTYNVKNHPDFKDTTDMVRANIIIYNGSVIAADISILDEEGSVNTLDFPGDVTSVITTSNNSVTTAKNVSTTAQQTTATK